MLEFPVHQKNWLSGFIERRMVRVWIKKKKNKIKLETRVSLKEKKMWGGSHSVISHINPHQNFITLGKTFLCLILRCTKHTSNSPEPVWCHNMQEQGPGTGPGACCACTLQMIWETPMAKLQESLPKEINTSIFILKGYWGLRLGTIFSTDLSKRDLMEKMGIF